MGTSCSTGRRGRRKVLSVSDEEGRLNILTSLHHPSWGQIQSSMGDREMYSGRRGEPENTGALSLLSKCNLKQGNSTQGPAFTVVQAQLQFWLREVSWGGFESGFLVANALYPTC